ncbi:MAG: hypothetical protein ACFNQI_08885 [Eikenella corrodens]
MAWTGCLEFSGSLYRYPPRLFPVGNIAGRLPEIWLRLKTT